jgi:TrmH family RNA methyltransferase
VTALAASNPRIRRLRRLSGRRSARDDERALVVEGPIWVREAVESGLGVEGLYLDEGADDLDELVALAAHHGVPAHVVAAGVLAGVSDVVTPRPVLAVVAMPSHELSGVAASALAERRPVAVLVEVRDPGNVGTIVRAAEGAGAAGVVCCTGTADPWAPKVVRASAGSVLRVPVVAGLDVDTAVDTLRGLDVPLLVTSSHDGVPYDEAPLGEAHALLLGNEARGLPEALAGAADHRVTIPLEGRAESLNVAMAASVLLFDAQRRRRRHSDWTPDTRHDKVSTS